MEPIGVTQFTFPEAKFGVSCLDYLAFFDLNPASGKVLQAQLRKFYEYPGWIMAQEH